jgi:hypothetical protein
MLTALPRLFHLHACRARERVDVMCPSTCPAATADSVGAAGSVIGPIKPGMKMLPHVVMACVTLLSLQKMWQPQFPIAGGGR